MGFDEKENDRTGKGLSPAPRLSRCFSGSCIQDAIDNDRMLSLSIKLPCACNLKCVYCYSEVKTAGMGFRDFERIFYESAELGCRSVSIIGEGEPLLYKDKESGKDVSDVIRSANNAGLEAVLFTNNVLVDERWAAVLYKLDVCVVCKLNSLDPDIQDFFSGVKGAHKKISDGLSLLEKTGFTRPRRRLSVHTVICRHNYEELPALWKYLRRRGIIPYFQVFVPPANHNSVYTNDLIVEKNKIRELFYLLAKIDEEFGFTWDPEKTYPIAGLGCSVVKTGCCVNSSGGVQLCGYVEGELGNIRERPLAEIIADEKVRKIRRYEYYGNEGRSRHFYGCRAAAFNTAGDRYAKDCFFFGEEPERIKND